VTTICQAKNRLPAWPGFLSRGCPAGARIQFFSCPGRSARHLPQFPAPTCTHARRTTRRLLCYRCPCFLRATRKSPQAHPRRAREEGRDFRVCVRTMVSVRAWEQFKEALRYAVGAPAFMLRSSPSCTGRCQRDDGSRSRKRSVAPWEPPHLCGGARASARAKDRSK
jgi:hypothetical protein